MCRIEPRFSGIQHDQWETQTAHYWLKFKLQVIVNTFRFVHITSTHTGVMLCSRYSYKQIKLWLYPLREVNKRPDQTVLSWHRTNGNVSHLPTCVTWAVGSTYFFHVSQWYGSHTGHARNRIVLTMSILLVNCISCRSYAFRGGRREKQWVLDQGPALKWYRTSPHMCAIMLLCPHTFI